MRVCLLAPAISLGLSHLSSCLRITRQDNSFRCAHGFSLVAEYGVYVAQDRVALFPLELSRAVR